MEGIYKTKIKKEGKYMILTYPIYPDIIGSYDPEHKETLYTTIDVGLFAKFLRSL